MSKKFEENENGLFNKLPAELIFQIADYSTEREISSLKTTCHQANNLNFNSLFQKLPSEVIMYTAVYLNLADLFIFRRVCHRAKNLNVSEALNNILSKPLRLRTDDHIQFFLWKSLLGNQALNMQIRDALPDFKLEQKIPVFHFKLPSYEIPPETFNEISVNFFKSVKPQLEAKRSSAEKKSCLIM